VSEEGKNKGGRPSKYTPELVASICARLAEGEPLAQICRDEGMPHPSTVRDWADAKPDVSLAIARAREDGFDRIALEVLEIADDGTRDYVVGEDGREIVNHDHIQRAKLRVETRLKLLAKWDPKRFGDRQAIEHTGANGGPIETKTAGTPEERKAELAALLAANPKLRDMLG
jgi:hypothetical protein